MKASARSHWDRIVLLCMSRLSIMQMRGSELEAQSCLDNPEPVGKAMSVMQDDECNGGCNLPALGTGGGHFALRYELREPSWADNAFRGKSAHGGRGAGGAGLGYQRNGRRGAASERVGTERVGTEAQPCKGCATPSCPPARFSSLRTTRRIPSRPACDLRASPPWTSW